jgi:hypothetical protein
MGLSRYYRVDWVTPVATGSTPYTNYYYRPNSVTNSSGTTYLIGNIQGGGNYYQSAVALNSSFAVTNQVVFSPNWSQGYGSENGAIALDNAGNIYAGDGSTSFGVLKLNSSLVYQWAYKYSLPVNYSSVSYQGIVVDSSNNFYLCGMATNNTSTYREIIVLKCNSSGVLQWARRISNSNYHLYNPSMVLISDNTLGLSIGAPNGQNNNNMPMLYMQYPTSGSYTGSKSVLLSTPAYTYAMDISTISLSTTSVGASTTVSSSVNSTSVGPTAGTVTPNQSGGSFVSTTATGGF